MINTNEVLKKYGLKLTKTLGQNFLTDINIIRKIVEAGEVSSSDLVLEIGPGIGSMTAEIAKVAGKVITVEIDKILFRHYMKIWERFQMSLLSTRIL